jgi:Rrf2 family protein
MLALTRRTEYALIAACHLARVGGRVTSAREIAAEHFIPLAQVMAVLKQLHQAGLLRSVRGVRGGYLLGAPAADITLAAVVEAIEGPVRFVRCVPPHDDRATGCELVGCCRIRQPVQRVHEELVRFLNGVTVADLTVEESRTELQIAPAARKVMAQ